MPWRRLAIAALAVVTMMAVGVPSADAAPPVATDNAYTVSEDTQLSGNVVTDDTGSGSDSDPDTNLSPNATVGTNVTNGTLNLSTDGSFTYTPNANYNGTDSFTYTIDDALGEISNVATVTITITAVNDAPVAQDDAFTTAEDTQLTGNVTGDNGNGADSDIEGTLVPNALVVTSVTNGTLALNADGSFTYTPNANYNGTDTFTYTVSDGTATSNTATVTITITAVNDVPTAQDDAFTTDEDTQLTGNVTGDNGNGADSDIEGTLVPNALVVTSVTNGTLALNADGSFTYTPNANYNGTDTFTYTVSDGTATSNTATVTITINPVYDPPPPAAAPAFDDLGGLSDEAVAAIETLVEMGITTGTDDTSFSPAMITERWQMALFLTRVLEATGTTLPPAGSGFLDLAGYSTEAQTAMNQLSSLGISTGTSPDEFSPAGAVTRSQMALFLVRTLDAGGIVLPAAGQSTFTDLAGHPDEVQAAVDVLVSLGITTGTTESTFSPEVELPRWQMALFLARVIEVIQAG